MLCYGRTIESVNGLLLSQQALLSKNALLVQSPSSPSKRTRTIRALFSEETIKDEFSGYYTKCRYCGDLYPLDGHDNKNELRHDLWPHGCATFC